MFKRTIAAVGNPASYVGYAIPLFVIYFLDNTFLSNTATVAMPSTIQPILVAVYGLVVSPFLLAGLFGAIQEQQATGGETGVGEFLANAGRYYWRVAGVNFFGTAVALVVSMAIVIASSSERPTLIAMFVDIPTSIILLFWFTSVVAEGGLFASFGRALRVLLRNPLALALGILWALFRFTENSAFEALGLHPTLAWNAIDAAGLSVGRVLAAVYAIAHYRQIRGEALEAQPAVTVLPGVPQATTTPPDAIQEASDQGLTNASLGFGIASFIPLVHLVALILGFLAIRRSKHFSLKPLVAICLGGFFTAVYTLFLAGSLIGTSNATLGPGISFLEQENPAMIQQVGLLRQSGYEAVQGQLESAARASTTDWTVHSALAIARWGNSDLDGALESFYAAAQQKPDRSEFYYYYGQALLAKGQYDMAAEQFQNATQASPRLVMAERYASLLEAAYEPSRVLSAAFTIIVLLILFTVHEYGHAYAAWKLGDDTAKNLGRITLSPIAHLDLFGSILLPGLLLLQGSGFIFGWAKPVPVNPENFKNPRRDHMLVSFAGPAVNLLVAMACFLVLGCIALALRVFWPGTLTLHFANPSGATALIGPPFAQPLTIALIFIKQLMYTSLILGFFNLLPVPPLDGSWILSGFLPEGLRNVYEGFRRFGFVLFLIIAYTPIMNYFLRIPILGAWDSLYYLISSVGLG